MPSEYPMTVDGVTWVNSSAFIVEKAGPCFFCGNDTYIVDINFNWYYCQEDDEAIRKDLEKLDNG